jgi:hypothetical protein
VRGVCARALLIVGESATASKDGPPEWICASRTAVAINRSKNVTQVKWSVSDDQSDTLIHNPQVFVLHQKAALDRYRQGRVYYSPLEAVHWSPSAIGLPPLSVYALT